MCVACHSKWEVKWYFSVKIITIVDENYGNDSSIRGGDKGRENDVDDDNHNVIRAVNEHWEVDIFY